MTGRWVARVIVATLLLAGTAGAQELRPVAPLPPSGPPTSEASKKIVSSLRALVGAFRALGITSENAAAMRAGDRFSSPMLKVSDTGRVQVDVTVTDTTEPTLAALRRHGLEIEIVNPSLSIVEGWIPVESLESLAGEPAVVKIRPPSYGIPNAGLVTSQGDAIHRCDQARALGVTGAGIKVGVISNGVAGLAASQATGDLPPEVEVLNAGTGDEGTAMLEIVHDCAPGASLAFAGASTSLGFIAAVNNLIAAGARVVADDIVFTAQPQFEDGPIAQNEQTAGTQALRVTAAGNQARGHYQASFVAGGSDPDGFGTRHDFGGGDTLLRISIGAGVTTTIVLQWPNPFGESADDYDLIVRDPAGGVVATSREIQGGTEDPIERVIVACNGPAACAADVEVTKFLGSNQLIDLRCYSCTFSQFNVPAGSINPGQAASPVVLAVAASPASNPTTSEPFSAQGPATIFFPFLQSRNKPDVTGTDGVSTTRPGFNPFFGTSAAAPHVAAVGALVFSLRPGLSAQQVRQVLTGSAVDLGPAGFDFAFGSGRADAPNAIAAAGALPIFADVPDSNFALAFIEALYRAGVTGGCTPVPLQYCPDSPVTREQMAVFILKAKEGAGFTPPPCLVPIFTDVSCSSDFAPWIQELARRGISAGCGPDLYCPTAPVTRDQMAVFLLVAKGVGPAVCAGLFVDVPCTNDFAGFIEQLVALGITAGCAPGRYCPRDSVTRAQMAVFLVKTFNLPL